MKNDPVQQLLHDASPHPRLSDADAFWTRFREAAKQDARQQARDARLAALLRDATPVPRLKEREAFWADFRTHAKQVVPTPQPEAGGLLWRYRKAAAAIPALAASLIVCFSLLRPMSAEAGSLQSPEIQAYEFYEDDVLGSSVLTDDTTDTVLLWAICDDAATDESTELPEADEADEADDADDAARIRAIRAQVSTRQPGDIQ